MEKKMVFWMMAVVALLAAGTAQAEWTEPVLLEELNTEHSATTSPCLSSDGLTIYFRRNDIGGNKQIVEAYRDTPDGIFTSERVLTELNNGRDVYSTWISQDGLTLYYGRYDGGTTRIIIRAAHRANITDPWSGTHAFNEIHINGTNDKQPSLTADELTMFYRSDRSGKGAIWMATRSSLDLPFSSPTLVSELGDNVSSPCVLPDGLTIYFHAKLDGHSTIDIYRATRTSNDEPFSNIQMFDISTELFSEGDPYVTPDEKSIYFYSNRGELGVGIWFSELIEHPFDIAIENIQEAIEEKKQAIGFVTVAIRKERASLAALEELLECDETGGLKPQNIHQAIQRIAQAIGRQEKIRKELGKSIRSLNIALWQLGCRQGNCD